MDRDIVYPDLFPACKHCQLVARAYELLQQSEGPDVSDVDIWFECHKRSKYILFGYLLFMQVTAVKMYDTDDPGKVISNTDVTKDCPANNDSVAV